MHLCTWAIPNMPSYKGCRQTRLRLRAHPTFGITSSAQRRETSSQAYSGGVSRKLLIPIDASSSTCSMHSAGVPAIENRWTR